MKNLDRLSSIFFILLSIAICLSALKLPGGTLSNPGPMIFPLLLGLSLSILSIVLFIQSSSPSLSKFSELFQKGEGLKIVFLLGTFALSIIIFEPIGFLISMFVLMVLLLKGIGRKTFLKSIFYGFIICLPTYLIFTRFLGVRLPKGVLWF